MKEDWVGKGCNMLWLIKVHQIRDNFFYWLNINTKKCRWRNTSCRWPNCFYSTSVCACFVALPYFVFIAFLISCGYSLINWLFPNVPKANSRIKKIIINKLKLLVVFSVTPFKVDQYKKSNSFNRLSPESGNRKKIDMQRLSPRFRSQQFFLWKICGETFFSKIIEICMETPCWCPPRWAPTWRPETSRNICHWVLLQKREFIRRRTEKRNNNTLF